MDKKLEVKEKLNIFANNLKSLLEISEVKIGIDTINKEILIRDNETGYMAHIDLDLLNGIERKV